MTERASDDEISNSAAANDERAQETDPEKRSKFGTRFLTDPQNVFQHNAWDNVVWDEEQETMAQQITEKHIKTQVSDEKKDQFEKEADQFWDKFYGQHQNRFFKDRHWLFTEFPELYGKNKDSEASNAASSSCVPGTEQVQGGSECRDGNNKDFKETNSFNMLEIGCGVGNTVFPVLKTNNDPNLMMYCCDFSHTAIDIVKNHPDYDSKRCHAFVHDLTDDTATMPFPPGSLDVIIMIFVLSAVKPDKMQESVLRLASYLKPGGILLFRDYGRYDLAQLRFKEGRCMSENFYVRGDGTFVYFFTQEELRELFTKAGLTEKENLVDRRLQVNRSRQLKMYRVWIQCKYIKPLLELECDLNAPVSS